MSGCAHTHAEELLAGTGRGQMACGMEFGEHFPWRKKLQPLIPLCLRGQHNQDPNEAFSSSWYCVEQLVDGH